MTRCQKCNSTNVTQEGTFYFAEQLEEETQYSCNHCGAKFKKYSDITDPDVRRDVRNQLEIQQYERPF